MLNRTLSILKPDVLARGLIGAIISDIEKAGFIIKAQKLVYLTRCQAEKFYSEHIGKSFFNDFINFMISGPIIVQVLERDNAIVAYRELIGSTNPEQQKEGTIRKKFATDITHNCVHGSDGMESAQREIKFFFSEMEIL